MAESAGRPTGTPAGSVVSGVEDEQDILPTWAGSHRGLVVVGSHATASSTAVHEVRPGSNAAMKEYGQPASPGSSAPGSSRDRRHGRPSAPRSSVCPGVASGMSTGRRDPPSTPRGRCCAAITNRSPLIPIAAHHAVVPRRRDHADARGTTTIDQRLDRSTGTQQRIGQLPQRIRPSSIGTAVVVSGASGEFRGGSFGLRAGVLWPYGRGGTGLL